MPVSSLPSVAQSASYSKLASLTVFSVLSAEVPPMTKAIWYGGQAAVPSVRIFLNEVFQLASRAALWSPDEIRLLAGTAAFRHAKELVLVAIEA